MHRYDVERERELSLDTYILLLLQQDLPVSCFKKEEENIGKFVLVRSWRDIKPILTRNIVEDERGQLVVSITLGVGGILTKKPDEYCLPLNGNA